MSVNFHSRRLRKRHFDRKEKGLSYEALESRAFLSADGIVVANYRADFSNPDSDWSYSYNTTEQLHGDEAQFRSLEPNNGIRVPQFESLDSGALRLTASGGHPGRSGDRFAVATWNVSEPGVYSISESFAKAAATGFVRADGIEYRVFVNGAEPLLQESIRPGEFGYFDMSIGFLNPGDQIQVAFGSRSNHAFDSFETDFSIRVHADRSQGIADFRQTVSDDADPDSQGRVYQSQWQTLWNAPNNWNPAGGSGLQSTGSINDVASYRPLDRSAAGTLTTDGTTDTSKAPQYFLRFDNQGGHTGIGFSESSNFEDRFVIAAQTIERSGPYSLADSFLNVSSRSSDGVELRVFVNDPLNPHLETVVQGGGDFNFSQSLGNLKKGDVVYVAFGPNDTHNGDRFRTNFSLVRELPRAEPLRKLETQIVINARDFGAIPNDRGSDVAGIEAALNAAKLTGVPTKVVLEPGVYNIYSTPEKTVGNLRYFFSLIGHENLEFDGRGAKIVVENNDRGLFRVLDSQNVILRNFTIDYAELYQALGDPADDVYRVNTYSQGLISNVDQTSRSFTLTIDPEVTIPPDESFIFGRVDGVRAWGFLLEGDSGSRLKYNSRWHYQTRDVQSLGNRQYRISVDSLHNFEDGDRYVLQRRTNVGAIGTFRDSSQISVIDVSIHSAPSAFVTAKEAAAINVIRSHAKVDVESGRWRSINADAVHGQSLRTGFWVEDSSFDAVSDDVMNFYSVPSAAVAQPTANQLTIATVTFSSLAATSSNKWQVGDIAGFVDAVEGKLIREARVTAVSATTIEVPDVGELSTQTLTFDQPISNIRFASTENGTDPARYLNDTTIYNQSVSRGFLVQGSTLSNARRYGQFVMANDVQLVDSTYLGLTDSAIAGHNESNWPIGLYSQNVLVQNNRFLRSGFSQRYFQERYFAGVVAFHADRLGHQLVDRSDYLYSRITISDNIFRGWGKTAIAVRNASNITIENNRIFSPLAFPMNDRGWFAVDVQFNRDLEIKDNNLFSNVQFLNEVQNEFLQFDESA